MILTAFIILLLLLANALFVAAEFALVGAPRTAIDQRAARGSRIARYISRAQHDPVHQDRYIATAQIGITLASLGLGMYGEHVLAEWLAQHLTGLPIDRWLAAHTLASALAVGLLTFLHIVLGEMVPKSLALLHAEQTVLWIGWPMRWCELALLPLVLSLNGLGNLCLRLIGIRRQAHGTQSYHTPEELQYIVQESQEGGLLRVQQGRVLQDLFQFGDRTAGEVMQPRVRITGLPLKASVGKLKEILRATRHTRFPVYEQDLDHIVGMIHIKDLLRLLLANRPLERPVVRPVPFVPETSDMDTVLDVMHRGRTHLVIVMDEHGGTAGLITIEDLFEEVVGELPEGAGGNPDLYRDEAGLIHASGLTRLDELGEELGLLLEHEEVATVSGLILMLLERPPVVGDAVEYDGVQFEVLAVEGRGVEECLVTARSPVVPPRGD